MTSKIRIEKVQDSASLGQFIRAPARLYRQDPQYVAPLEFERRQALGPKNPYFEHAQWQAWVAWRDQVPVGRISAQIDNLEQSLQGSSIGHFGFFESEQDPAVAAALFQTAEAWLQERGVTTVSGPFNLGVNQELGLLVEGFDSPPFFMMPHGLPYYDELVTGCGYSGVQDLLALISKSQFTAPPVMTKLMERSAGKVKLRELDRSRLTDELHLLRDIFNDAWQDNWGFVPFTEAEFQALGRELIMWIPKDFVQIAEVEGEAAAFIVLVPNVNEAIKDLDGKLFPFGWAKFLWRMKISMPQTARVPLMGVRKSFQQTRLGPGLAFKMMETAAARAHDRGIKHHELSWILESNQGMLNILDAIGARVSKRYRMYEKAL